jgi:pimeloyl-ACP methyl ester carboxylesterase
MTARDRRFVCAALAAACVAWPAAGVAQTALADCHVAGIRNGVLCGRVQRPLDPEHPGGGTITIEYVVVPAMARRKIADPVFMLAGGPGQGAVAIAAPTMPLFARLNNRRDIVFVDQRGTGGSAPLLCKDEDTESLAEQSQPDRQFRLALQCKADLLKLPYIRSESDLGFFTTSIAVQDLDAVRRQLGAERIDLVGGSYGTRVALEYLRQYPKAVRRTVLDGVAPPDMVLPASYSIDNQAAFDSLAAACAAAPECARTHPGLPARFAALLQSLPKAASGMQPLTGRDEKFILTRDMVLAAVRGALYSPALASALPEAIDAAARGDLRGLLGLDATLFAKKSARLATGMHLSVVCAEDVPRLPLASDKPGADFGNASARMYQKLCSIWPRGAVPAAFYGIPVSASPALVLSGGIDPVTPPRHGERVARALGPMARHVVVANAGHGVMAIGCMRDVVFRFIDATTDGDAEAVDAGCAARVPRPPAFESIRAVATAASEAAR